MFESFIERKISSLLLADKVFVCKPEDSLRHALMILKENNIGAVVVLRDDCPAGIFTERDYIRKIAGNEHELLNQPISEFMTPNVKTVTFDTPIKFAMGIMRMGKFRHLVVTDENNKLLNIISLKDVLDYLIDAPNSL